MLTPYDKKQQAAERRAAAARCDLDTHLLTGEVPPLLFEAVGELVYDIETDTLKVVQR